MHDHIRLVEDNGRHQVVCECAWHSTWQDSKALAFREWRAHKLCAAHPQAWRR